MHPASVRLVECADALILVLYEMFSQVSMLIFCLLFTVFRSLIADFMLSCVFHTVLLYVNTPLSILEFHAHITGSILVIQLGNAKDPSLLNFSLHASVPQVS